MSNLKSTILCKLCENRQAGSQASHIIPKFFTKSIYFKNAKNQGMKTMKFVEGIMGEVENDWQQDGLKQKDLFCSYCEKYFELLDTHFSNEIYKPLRNSNERNKHFLIFKLKHTIASCEKANENIVALFLISLFIRCHASDLPFCKNFELTNEEYSYLRNLLNQYYSLKQTELQEKSISMPIENLFSYLVFTCANNSRINANENFIESQYRSSVGIYYLIVNDYIFSLYLQKPPSSFFEALNSNTEKVKIILLNDKEFNISRTINFKKYLEENFFSKFKL